MSQRVRVGVVGAGLHGEMHLEAYKHSDRCDLAGICDLDADRAQRMAEKYGCDWTTDINELAAMVDGASIATPDFAHLEPALALIGAGKHLLMEKPLTTNVADGERLVAAAREAGVKLMVNFSNRWNPKFLAARTAISDGRVVSPAPCRHIEPTIIKPEKGIDSDRIPTNSWQYRVASSLSRQ